MVAYNFKAEFEGPILSGNKRSTFRPKGKRRHARPGDRVQLYTGMRTKNCRLLSEVVCTEADECQMIIEPGRFQIAGVLLGGHANQLARLDGFTDWQALREWFTTQYGHGHFEMVRVVWGPAVALRGKHAPRR